MAGNERARQKRPYFLPFNVSKVIDLNFPVLVVAV